MKTPEAKAAEEADRVQLVEALAAHPGTPWGEAIEKVAALRIERDELRAALDELRATQGNNVVQLPSAEPWVCVDCERTNPPETAWCPACTPERASLSVAQADAALARGKS